MMDRAWCSKPVRTETSTRRCFVSVVSILMPVFWLRCTAWLYAGTVLSLLYSLRLAELQPATSAGVISRNGRTSSWLSPMDNPPDRYGVSTPGTCVNTCVHIDYRLRSVRHKPPTGGCFASLNLRELRNLLVRLSVLEQMVGTG